MNGLPRRRTRGERIPGLLGLLLVASLLFIPRPAGAQLEAAVDLSYRHDLVWRGLTRVSRPTFQPALVLGWKSPSWLVSAGGWTVLEPFEPKRDDLTLAGRDALVGEVDAWAEVAYRARFFSAVLDLNAGSSVYTFHAEPGTSGLTDARNTHEVYGGLRLMGLREVYSAIGLPPELPVGIEATAAADLDAIGGWYGELALRAELPLVFVGEPLGAAIVRLTSGWSWNQEETLTELGRYDGEGPTHLALSARLTPFFQPGGVPLTFQLGGTVQLGFDDAVRRRGPGAGQDAVVIAWMDVGVSLLFPLRRKP